MDEQRERALILVDYSNWHYYLKDKGWCIDWQKFADFWRQGYTVAAIYYFEGIISEPYYNRKHPNKDRSQFDTAKQKKNAIFRWIKSCGIKVDTKPINVVYDKTSGKHISKCNFDVEITIQALSRLNEYDELILCSGDGDFIRLVRFVKGNHKRVTVVAPPERTNKKLRSAANDFKPLSLYRKYFQMIDDDPIVIDDR